MNVLFTSRAKKGGQVSPIVKAQGVSLSKQAFVDFYTISGKGFRAYLNNIPSLKRYIRKTKADIIHAHYSFSGYTAALTFSGPVVCSLMGSDIQVNSLKKFLITFFGRFFWKAIIVKSSRMKEQLGLDGVFVLPNGVNFDIFKPASPDEARNKISFNQKKRLIVFIANPERKEKNFSLAEEACSLLSEQSIFQLQPVYDVDHSLIPAYLSAADVLLLTSKWEGSPNVIKEAMACNCPIVSTDVGDVKEVIGDTEGCYITTFEPEDVAAKLKFALEFGKRTNGREKIRHLDDKIIAQKLVEVYKSVLTNVDPGF